MELSDRPRARLFVTAALGLGFDVPLTPAQAHYLRTVLRLTPGAVLTLFNGCDGEWAARLDSVGKAAGAATVLQQRRTQRPGPDIWLCFAPIKRPGIDFVVEKATELGAGALQPVITRHTHVGRVNLDRLIANAVEAAEQCERLDVPEVRPPVLLDALLTGWKPDRALLVAAEAGAARPLAEAALSLRDAPAALLIGPEGGFATSELDGLAKLAFAHPVSLGPRILRTETAAVAALASWQCLAGDGDAAPPLRTRV